MRPEHRYDVVVAGGGMAGVAAAVSAAGTGATTAIVERYGFLGGMATAAQVGTICGLYLRSEKGPTLMQGGLVSEVERRLRERNGPPMRFAEGLWFQNYDPFELRCFADELLIRSGIKTFHHSTVFDACTEGSALEEIAILAAGERIDLRAECFVDATGDATLASVAGDELLDDVDPQAGAVVFQLEGLAIAEGDPALVLGHAILKGVQSGELEPNLGKISVVPGTFQRSAVYLKLPLPGVSTAEPTEIGIIEVEARTSIRELLDYLRKLRVDFSAVRISNPPAQIGIRTGRRPRGAYVLSEEDVLQCRKHADDVARGAWPIESWDASRGPKLSYFSPEDHYGIPVGALRSRRVTNLFYAGRNISASERAIASARVIGTCIATGCGAGTLAAFLAAGRSVETAVDAIQTSLKCPAG